MQLIQNKDLTLLHLSLARITFLSFEDKKNLLINLDSSHSLALLSIEDISKLLNREFSQRVEWDGKENLRMAEAELYKCQLLNIEILLHSDERYPELLRQIPDPPYLLFYRGDVTLLSGRSVSVVGTRRLSQAGKEAALSFARQAVEDGCNVVSGLANGADGFAHKGAIEAFYDCLEKGDDTSGIGKTIAVLPSAIDEVVPIGHRRLAAQLLQSGGCILSEYGPGIGMANFHFVARNRIIAGLSPATVVIEAPPGSGALITADFALEFGRDVLFHEAAVSNVALQISDLVHHQLERDFAAGRVAKYKLENTPKRYFDAGAPVIKNYYDYCTALSEAPGKRCEPVQGELFEV